MAWKQRPAFVLGFVCVLKKPRGSTRAGSHWKWAFYALLALVNEKPVVIRQEGAMMPTSSPWSERGC
jgi:hypothetical protein